MKSLILLLWVMISSLTSCRGVRGSDFCRPPAPQPQRRCSLTKTNTSDDNDAIKINKKRQVVSIGQTAECRDVPSTDYPANIDGIPLYNQTDSASNHHDDASTVDFTCATDYDAPHPGDTPKFKCNSGAWDNKGGSCEKTCDAPPTSWAADADKDRIDKGNIGVDKFKYGGTVIYSCKDTNYGLGSSLKDKVWYFCGVAREGAWILDTRLAIDDLKCTAKFTCVIGVITNRDSSNIQTTNMEPDDEDTVTCKTNYILKDERAVRKCVEDTPSSTSGKWDTDIECQAKFTCPVLNPTNGRLDVSSAAENPGDQALIACDLYYKIDGTSNHHEALVTCVADTTGEGKWDGKTNCIPNFKCTNTAIDNRIPAVPSPAKYLPDDEDVVTCQPNYILKDGISTRRCIEDASSTSSTTSADGQWSTTIECQAKFKCTNTAIDNRIPAVPSLAKYLPDDEDVVACAADYILKNGISTRRCIEDATSTSPTTSADGKWNTTIECQATCAELPDDSTVKVNHASIVNAGAGRVVDGTRANFTCKANYTMPTSGAIDSECSATNWTNPVPQCLPTCSKQTADDNGDVTYSSTPTNNRLLNGTTATFACNTNYVQDNSADKNMDTCIGMDKWSEAITAPKCVDAYTCNVPVMTNGTTNVTSSQKPGSILKVECDTDYKVNGTADSTLTTECVNDTGRTGKTGKWDHTDAVDCYPEFTCSDPSVTFPNSQRMTGEPFHPKTQVKVQCNSTYHPKGSATDTTCERNSSSTPNQGKWDPVVECEATCSKQTADNNGDVTYSPPQTTNNRLLNGTTATFACNTNYVQDNSADKNIDTCIGMDKWSEAITAPKCVATCNGSAIPVANGDQTRVDVGVISGNRFQHGGTVTYSCKDDNYGLGSSLENEVTYACGEATPGSWTDTANVSCIPKYTCTVPSATNGGSNVTSDTNPKQSALITCNANYKIKGTSTNEESVLRTCIEDTSATPTTTGGKWDGETDCIPSTETTPATETATFTQMPTSVTATHEATTTQVPTITSAHVSANITQAPATTHAPTTISQMLTVTKISTSTLLTPSFPGSEKYTKETYVGTTQKELTTSKVSANDDVVSKTYAPGSKIGIITTVSSAAATSNGATASATSNAAVISASIAPKLKQGMDDLFAELKEQRNKLNITFNEMGQKIGASKIKETGKVMVAVTDAVGLIAIRRRKRQTSDPVSLAMIGFAEQLTQMFGLGSQGIILNDLFVGLTAGATEAAKSDNNLKQKMDQLKNKLGSDANQAGKDAASNDITNNNGKQTKNIITALTTGVKAMNSKVDDKSVSDVKGSDATAIVISLFCIVIVIVGIVVFIFWRRRKNQMQHASDAKTRMLMTEKTQDSLCIELTEDTQSETEMTQSESSIKTLKTENKTERSEVRSANQPVQEEPRQSSQTTDQE